MRLPNPGCSGRDEIALKMEPNREFRPESIDVDDLAHAIQKLLDSCEPSDLLSEPSRATHVMGQGGQ